MRRGPLVVLAVLGLIVLVLGWTFATRGSSETPRPSVAEVASASDPAASADVPTPPSTDTPEPTADPTPSPTIAPSDPPATPEPTKAPSKTRAPSKTEAPQVSYVRFLARLAEDRSTVADLNQRLADAGEGGDRDTARATAVEILRFTDGERDYLAAHPPADCYAEAHAAAGSMVEAYAAVAERAIAWADAEGFDALTALADLVAAGDTARDALATLASTVEATSCP